MKKFTYILILVAFYLTFGLPTQARQQNTTPDKHLEYVNFNFWKNFNDKNLIENINLVYKNNNDLKATNFKVNEAKRLVGMSLANELPQIGFNGYVGEIFNSSDEVFGNITIPDYSEAHFLLPLTLNYEIDIWGKNHLKTKSWKKQLSMVQEDERAVYISLISNFATNYYNLIKADKLIDYQKALINNQEKIVNSVKKRYEIGTATITDVIFTEKTLTYMQEELNNLLEKQDVLENQMSVFLSDRGFEKINRTKYDDIKVSLVIPEEISTDVIKHRPDVAKSELQMEKIGIDVKIARKEILPTFTINGNLGFNMYSRHSSSKFLSNLGIVPNIDLFTGGRKTQYLKLQKDNFEIALQNYEKTTLKSIQETNDALYNLKSTNKNYSLVTKRLNVDNVDYAYTLLREQAGTADNLDILFKKEQQLITQKQEVSLKINEIISAINLYKALGGIDYITPENL
jgi:multidrug efflux system outer membrane protein